MAAPAAGNQDQAEYWSETGGAAWVAFQDQMDRQLSVVGAAALKALNAQPGESVLDIGCGCGATTIDLAAAVGPAGRVVGLDISAPMAALASRRLAECNFDHAATIVGDAQVADSGEIGGRVDAVFSRFGVMFFADPVAAFANIRALTKWSGRMAFVCWQGPTRNRIFGDFGRELAVLFPGLPAPDPIAPGPMAFADAERLMSILIASGWGGIEIEEHVAPMQLYGTTDFDLALETSMRIGGVARLLHGADADTTAKIRAVARRVLDSQWTEHGAVVDSATWIVRALNNKSVGA